MKKLFISLIFTAICFVSWGQNCPDNINNSPGQSPGSIEFIYYNSNGEAVDTITCYQTGNGSSVNIDCGNLSDSTDSIFLYGTITLNNGTECIYNSDGDLSPTLPIELLSFYGESDDRTNIIHWTTASERNNDYFTLERSQDGIHWEEIGIVDGSGNSSSKKDYEFIDEQPHPLTSYYKLKQTDYDGQNEYFDIISVENESDVFYTYTKQDYDGFIYFSDYYEYDLYNSIGQIVQSGEGNRVYLDNNRKGLHILKIGLYTQKVLVR